MSRTFRDSVTSDLANAFYNTNEFASTITYTVDGEGTDVTAIVFDEQAVEESHEAGREQRLFREVRIQRSDVANARLDATLTIDEVVYTVESITYQDEWETTLRVVRIESIEVSREHYRGD